ncbi:MAG TPA: bifunctional DNA-formamidopyrimidine glycosylase/DNA-(apurinic or apyrimidinic site) lyase [Candidatus Desulfofervidus auxilii]|uniref:Formamidopyrimidine-DNA glycosylase n=1 Tax=Desulfofervidus auxilii TaxID=1621989 RepID=A0A7C1VUV5_DESA2|nr:bifunctional DNA-formamidopyrimidine glycosylase/DNA-(apurinic or apyrimidinic site) lyase [Candidatus Desulfofervidus auxilii]
MPELPEVESIVQELRPCLRGLVPIQIICHKEKFLHTEQPLPNVLNHPITDISRRGKLILVWTSPFVWLIHLKMTGQLWWQPSNAPLPPHTHLIVLFKNTHYQLRYADLRQFGSWQIVPKKNLSQVPFLQKLGPDALTIAPSILKQRLQNKHTAIKSLLLNQQCLAGLGNIYSDEALWLARIHPLTPAYVLNQIQIKRLALAIQKVLKYALKLGGTSIRSYIQPNGQKGLYQRHLHVYGKKGLPCQRCGTAIERTKICGRSSYFCPVCQQL